MSSEGRLAANELGDITIALTGERRILTGWSGLQITRGIDSAADGFSFSFPWEASAANRLKFIAYRTTYCEIRHRGTVVVSGIIERISATYSANRRELTVEGRSRSGVLVDLSADPVGLAGNFNAISRRLCPETVRAYADPNIDDISVQIDAGQTIYEVLGSIAAGHGLWAQAQPDGSLKFSKIFSRGSARQITEGVDPIVSIDTTHDLTKRFYRYRVISTTGGSTYRGEAIDRGVDEDIRDGQVTEIQQDADPNLAAEFARSRGIMDSYTCNMVMTGWTVDGALWAPGMRLSIESPSAMIYNRGVLIVSRATLQLDESGGAITTLELTFPEIFAGGAPSFPYPWSLV